MADVSIIMPARITSEQHLKWLGQALDSALLQDHVADIVVVNDHSTVSWKSLTGLFSEERLRGYAAKDGSGVAYARNLAAEKATGPLLLPLDADDKLPKNAVTRFLEAWTGGEGSKSGIVYSDVMMFGDGTRRSYVAPKYSFETLLHATYMTIGCLHRKSDWVRAGGWNPQLDIGFEDWEYWIHLGELGVCGHHVNEVLYEYRRHGEGRTAKLRADEDGWNTAYAALRNLHTDTFNGRLPMGCCGGSRSKASRLPASATAEVVDATSATLRNPTTMVYIGRRTGSFGMRGLVGIRYRIPGRGKDFPIDGRDVTYFKKYGGGNVFKQAL